MSRYYQKLKREPGTSQDAQTKGNYLLSKMLKPRDLIG